MSATLRPGAGAGRTVLPRQRVKVGRLLRRLPLYITTHGALIAVGLIIAVPFLWTLSSSFKDISQIYNYPPNLIPDPATTQNYSDLFGTTNYLRWYLNSFGVAVIETILTVFFSSLAGFAFAKYTFKGQKALFNVMIGTLMVPFQLVLIPLFILMSKIGWTNTYQSLIIPFVAPAFGIFLMRQFMVKGIPSEMLEAGRIDGCTEFRLYWRLALPVSRPALGALSIFSFLGSWNSFIWPGMMMSSPTLLTLPLGIQNLLSASTATGYGQAMGAAFLASVPLIIVFMLMQRQFISGLTVGSVKG